METLVRRLRETQAIANLVGDSPVFLEAISPLPSVARGDAAVLITGETGTGKELIARAIHYLSERAPYPFVPVNCGSLQDTLLEDELFGHERGAFTDAHSRRTGLVAQAEKGTLFLDEVDTLTPKAQITLLRVLQDKRFRPVGGVCEHQANVRIVAATNCSLRDAVKAGTFRADLYYRICVFPLHLPPLRERKEDIPALAEHFLKKHTPRFKGGLKLSPAIYAELVDHNWPGNIRELENAIIRGAYLAEGDLVEIEDLGLPSASETASERFCPSTVTLRSFKESKQSVVTTFERRYLTQLMQEHQGNISQAARAAGKERRDLGKMLKKHHLDPRAFRAVGNPTQQ